VLAMKDGKEIFATYQYVEKDAVIRTGTVQSQASASVGLAGRERTVTLALPTRGVSMDTVRIPGSAGVTQGGGVPIVMILQQLCHPH